MITGKTLLELIAFEAEIVRHDIRATATRLLEADIDLHELRLKEIGLWYQAAGREAPINDELDRASDVLDERIKIIRCHNGFDEQIKKAQNDLENARENAEEIGETLKSLIKRQSEDEQADDLQSATEAVRICGERVTQLSNTRMVLSNNIATIIDRMRTDPLFHYLERRQWGRSDYAANAFSRVMDNFIAKKTRYGDVLRARWEADQELLWTEAALSKAQKDRAEALADEKKIQSRQAGERDACRHAHARALNEVDQLTRKLMHLKEEKAQSLQRIVDLSLGLDAASQANSPLVEEMKEARLITARSRNELPAEIGEKIDTIGSERLAKAMSADILRKKLVQLRRRMDEIESLIDHIRAKGWEKETVSFKMDESSLLPSDVASGRMDMERAKALLSRLVAADHQQRHQEEKVSA